MPTNNLPESLTRVISTVVRDFKGHGSHSLKEYSIDSFDLMTLRASLEEELKLFYSDEDWVEIKLFSDFVKYAKDLTHTKEFSPEAFDLSRSYKLNMPQMNVSGLSEYWYLKEIGDMHWRMIASSLGVPSDQILDTENRRLYATFVRIKYTSTNNFFDFRENDQINLRSEMGRFGSFFLTDSSLQSIDKMIKAELVTNFVARGGDNSSLFKSVPAEEVKVQLKNYTEIPSLIENYHLVRKNQVQTITFEKLSFTISDKALFETNYKLDPYHDINGVGLLYFAAYPHIYDVGEREFMNTKSLPKDWAFYSSTEGRDIFYLGNADLNENLKYRLLDFREENNSFYFLAELIRMSDNKRVSLCISKKGRSI